MGTSLKYYAVSNDDQIITLQVRDYHNLIIKLINGRFIRFCLF